MIYKKLLATESVKLRMSFACVVGTAANPNPLSIATTPWFTEADCMNIFRLSDVNYVQNLDDVMGILKAATRPAEWSTLES